jgi:glycosyltransferase involved in cell wall biosynthesis
MTEAVTNPDVSIVMPCLNEADSLPKAVGTAVLALKLLREQGLSGEIVVTDNGSSDGSQELAGRLGCRVVLAQDKGYGSALRAGIAACRGKYIVMGDSDASYDFRESVPMVRKLAEGYDICLGTRFKGTILPGAMPWKNQWIGNPVLTGVLNLFFRTGFSDAHCGMRGFTRDAFRRMNLTSSGMEFASEMAVKATLAGLRRTEVPVTLHADGRARPPHLRPWRDGWRHLRFLLVYSPLWCFIIPSFLAMAFGLSLLIALLLTPPGKNFWVGRIWFGDHWLMIAAAAIILGHHLWLSGMTGLVYFAKRLDVPMNRFGVFAKTFMTVENMCLLGTVLSVCGLSIVGYVVIKWTEANFGIINMTRAMTFGVTLFTIGVQSFFGGFLLSLVKEGQGPLL